MRALTILVLALTVSAARASPKTWSVSVLDEQQADQYSQAVRSRSAGYLGRSLFLIIAFVPLSALVQAEDAGTVDLSFDPGQGVDGSVYSIAIQSDKKILVAGNFVYVDGVYSNHIVRLNPEGTRDQTFNANLDFLSFLGSVAIQSTGKILIGGNLDEKLARLHPDGSRDTTFRVGSNADGIVNGFVNVIKLAPNGKILIGGSFTRIGVKPFITIGTSRSGIARLHVDGSLDLDFDPGTGIANDVSVDRDVKSIAFDRTTDKIYIGGEFTSFNGVARPGIARLNSNGSLDTDFNPILDFGSSFDRRVNSLVVQSDGKVVITGSFGSVGGVPSNGTARLNPDGSPDTEFTAMLASVYDGRCEAEVIALQSSGKLLLGGDLWANYASGLQNCNILRLNTEGNLDDSFAHGGDSDGWVYCLTYQGDGKIVIGGNFSLVKDVERANVARLFGDAEDASLSDIDGDGLPDEWELGGVTIDGSGRATPGNTGNGEFVDLPRMGADPLHKDIFIHVDWMHPDPSRPNSVFKPKSSAMGKVIDAFAKAPVDNPDGKLGVTLHIDYGPASIMNPKTETPWGTLSRAGEVPFQASVGSINSNNAYVWSDVDTTKIRFFGPARRRAIFHYALFCATHGQATNARSGISRGIPAADFLVTLGLDAIVGGTEDDQLGTFMHELGHNLGLHHGGSDDIKRKPNYLSVMNNTFQFIGLLELDGRRRFDYSRSRLDPLNEGNLDENVGINDPARHLTLWKCPVPGNTFGQPYYRLFLPTKALDWDLDGVKDTAPVPMDINCDGVTSPALTGFEDWPTLVFNGGGRIGDATGTVSDAMTTLLDELSRDEILSIVPQALLDEEALAPRDVATRSPREGEAPLAVNFDGSASTAVNGTIVDWSWDFGDGSTGSGATVTHTYTANGEYYASLNVTDSNGRVNLVPSLHLITVGPTPNLANISTRLLVETGDNVLIGGFIITGTQPKKIIVRAIGPSLASFFPGALADPVLELRNSSGGLIMLNDDWRSGQEAEIIATGLPPSSDLESAIVAVLPANGSAYTAIVHGFNNATGIGLVEAYDLDQTVDSKLANISTRGFVQMGDNVLIGGLIVLGRNPLRVIVRAIGPSLPLPGALGDPTLELYNRNGARLAANDNWRDNPVQEAEIIATGIPPANDLESAIVQDLAPGDYTAIVRGANNITGIAVVEAYGLN